MRSRDIFGETYQKCRSGKSAFFFARLVCEVRGKTHIRDYGLGNYEEEQSNQGG